MKLQITLDCKTPTGESTKNVMTKASDDKNDLLDTALALYQFAITEASEVSPLPNFRDTLSKRGFITTTFKNEHGAFQFDSRFVAG